MELTEEEIRNMRAGPDADEKVAIDVMGWTRPAVDTKPIPPCPPLHNYLNPSEAVEKWRTDYHWREPNGICWSTPRRFTTDIAAAWDVWEKCGGEKRLHFYNADNEYVCFVGGVSYGASSDYAEGFQASAEAAPLAICRAALLALR